MNARVRGGLRKLARLAVVTAAGVASAAGCAASRPPAENAENASPGGSTFASALEKARARRADIESSSPPAYSGDGSRRASQLYMQQLGEWGAAVAKRFDGAIDAYAAAARLAPGADGEMATILEALDLGEKMQRRFLDAADRALPTAWRSMPDVVQIFRQRLEGDSSARFLAATLEHCVERAKALAVETPATQRCRQGLARVEAVKRQTAAKTSESDFGSPPDMPSIATSRPAPCAFAGSMTPRQSATLYATRTGGAAIGALDAWNTARIDLLQLPVAAGGRYKVVLSYPVRVTAWLDASARPFELPGRVDLVPGRVWFEGGAMAAGASAGASRIRLTASLPPRQPAGETGGPAPDSEWSDLADPPDLDGVPARAGTVVDCSRVLLAQSTKLSSESTTDAKSDAKWVLLKTGSQVRLFRDAEGRSELGRVRGHSGVRLLEQSGKLVHVSGGGEGYDFDGWVRPEDVTDEPAMGIIATLGGMRLSDAFRPRGSSVGVRLQPDASAPVVMTLAPEAVAHQKGTQGDFAQVEITGLASDGPAYFVLRADLEPYRVAPRK